MSIVSSIALSGLSASSLRLQVSASNVANAGSSGPLPGGAGNYPAAYTPQRVVQVEAPGGGTSANITAVSPATVPVFDPAAPFADGQGMVAMPNVDLGSEIVQQLMARISFAANAQVIRADAKMSAALLDIKV